MNLQAEKLIENYEKLLKIVESTFNSDRKTKLLKLYGDLEERLLYCPASSKDYYHCCFPGGLIFHTLNVIENAILLDELWTKQGQIKNYTYEELAFSSMNHDLGKVGDLEQSYYVESKEKWKKERGELYSTNPDLRYMSVSHRSLWLLQQYDIKYSQTEMIAILLHDGLYDSANEGYLKTYYENKQLRDNLPIILHQSDMMSMSIERDQFRNETELKKTSPSKSKNSVLNKDIAVQFFKED